MRTVICWFRGCNKRSSYPTSPIQQRVMTSPWHLGVSLSQYGLDYRVVQSPAGVSILGTSLWQGRSAVDGARSIREWNMNLLRLALAALSC